MQRGKIRNAVLFSALSTLFSSLLFRSVLILIICVVTAIFSGKFIITVFPVLWCILFSKYLIFEILVVSHVIETNLGIMDWYNYVDDDLYLGAIPLDSMDHKSVLALDLRVEAVLSILEDFEFNCSTLGGRPIQPDEWKREDMEHTQLNSKDFYPPSFQILEEGADWINSHLIKGKRVYCHCKSGIGRSASVVLAYYMKYKRMSALAAYEDLKSHRPMIFHQKSRQMINILAYETYRNQKVKENVTQSDNSNNRS